MPITKDFVTDFAGNGNGSTSNAVQAGNFQTAVRAGGSLASSGAVTLTFQGGGGHNFNLAFTPIINGAVVPVILDGGGNTTLTNPPRQWTDGIIADPTLDTHSARFQTVVAGATQISLVTAGDTSKFTAGKRALLMGLATQQATWPPNNVFFEYLTIATSGVSSGVVTFTTALQYGYKSTWPVYDHGGAGVSNMNIGGAATIIQCNDNSDAVYEIKDLTLADTTDECQPCGKDVTLTNVTFTFTAALNPGFAPTASRTLTLTNCNQTTSYMEFDKLCDTAVIDGGTWNRMILQSSGFSNSFTVKNLTTQGISGGANRLIIDNCTIQAGGAVEPTTKSGLVIGCVRYGRNLVTTATNSTIGSIYGVATGGQFANNVAANYSIAGGADGAVITVPKAIEDDPEAQWAIPGMYCYFARKPTGARMITLGKPFRILDVVDTGSVATGNVLVYTNLAGSTWPTLPGDGTNGICIAGNPCPDVRFTNCSGDEAINGLAADLSQTGAYGKPLHSYSKRQYNSSSTASIPTALGTLIPIYGNITSIKINVISAYTGGVNPLNLSFMRATIINSSGTESSYAPTVNLRQVGERIITANSVVSFSGDSISAPAVSGNVWIAGSDVFYAGAAYDISAGWFPTVNTAYNKADGLDVTIEFITDQGVTGDTTPSTGHGKIRLPRGQVHHPAGWHFVRGAEK